MNRSNPQYILPYKPHVNENQVISQTKQWHKVSSCFRATEAAQYLTIGNFFTDQETHYVAFNDGRQGAYYLIDDVSVTETNLTELPTLALRDTTLCPAKAIVLSLPHSSPIQYQWQDGTNSSTYTIRQAGVYSVTATAGQCVVTDTFQVAQEMTLRLAADTTLCRGSTISLTPVISVNNKLRWSDGSQGPTLRVSETGLYWVRSESPACQQVDSIRVSVVDCPGMIPNVFTPNKDGVNDTFFIANIDLTPWRLVVYNRWGRQVYSSDAYQNDWSGDDLPSGLYYYHLFSRVLQRQYKGWVQVLR